MLVKNYFMYCILSLNIPKGLIGLQCVCLTLNDVQCADIEAFLYSVLKGMLMTDSSPAGQQSSGPFFIQIQEVHV